MPQTHWIAETYDALGAGLYRHALMILADRGLAEDTVQQAFLRLLARGRMDDLVSAEACLRTIVRHEAYAALARRRPTEALAAADARLLEPVHESVELAEEERRLESALRQLPAEQREVIHLKLWQDMTFAQIGELLGIPQNTAASRYRYALARLREIMVQRRI